ncbi:MAG: hypothetical protein IKU19_09735 [Clostridia bacterium]|nr:hypothetical protein [Clostridia bacterium]
MKKVYTKPELELIDLSAKELLMGPDNILGNDFELDIWGDETDVSLPEGWM